MRVERIGVSLVIPIDGVTRNRMGRTVTGIREDGTGRPCHEKNSHERTERDTHENRAGILLENLTHTAFSFPLWQDGVQRRVHVLSQRDDSIPAIHIEKQETGDGENCGSGHSGKNRLTARLHNLFHVISPRFPILHNLRHKPHQKTDI
jgi:hypothetical protein